MLTIAQVRELGGYGVILADMAWRYDDRGCRGAAEPHYTEDTETKRSTMSLAEICALPIGEIAAPDCALFFWCTWPLDDIKYVVYEAWGFQHKTLAFDWVKYYDNSCRPFYGGGRFTRANSEPCWLATRGKPRRVDSGVGNLIETIEGDGFQVIQAGHGGEHSKKPDEVRHRIKRLMGAEVPALELCARQRVDGWDSWGNDPAIGVPDVMLTGKERMTCD